MSTQKPRVSIGMPVYNGAQHIREAVDSILDQSFADFEFVICDNASTDRTDEICREFASRDARIRYFRNEKNLGAAANFNKVFEQSVGEYFKWMSHDDILAPEYLQRCVETLDTAPESVVGCFTGRRWMRPNGQMLGALREPIDRRSWGEFHRMSFARLVRQPGSYYPMFVFGLTRSRALRKTGLIGAYNAADLVLVAELRLLGELWQVPSELYYQRLHEETPELQETRWTAQGEAIWFDPANRDRPVFPRIRLLREYVAAIRRSPVGFLRKMWFIVAVFFGRPWSWLALRCRPIRRFGWNGWSRVSVWSARVSNRASAPLRVWAAAGSLRRKRIGMAARILFDSRCDIQEELVAFATERLARRMDPASHELLVEWAGGGCELRRHAATLAMSRRPQRFGRILQETAGTAPPIVHRLEYESTDLEKPRRARVE